LPPKNNDKKKRGEAITEGSNYLNLGISIFDDNLKLVFANKKLLDLLGFPYSFAEPGTPLDFFCAIMTSEANMVTEPHRNR